MLRVSTLYADTSVATAAYYTRYLTQADGEQPGQWAGRQAALLGLSGEVTTEDLQALLEGRDPGSGVSLGWPFVNRVTSSGRLVRAVAGFDATLSAPKSLSVWWELTGDDALAGVMTSQSGRWWTVSNGSDRRHGSARTVPGCIRSRKG